MPLTNNYCVYKHTNKLNGKVYIGITRQNPEKRWQKGAGYARTYFGNAIAKYGWDNFTHEVLFTGLSKAVACEKGKQLIESYGSRDRHYGYNICEGGQTGDNLVPYFGADNFRAVAVQRIDPKTGESVVYNTNHAAATEMGINYRGISKACRGICRTYKGYIWEYADFDFEKPVHAPIGKYDHIKQRKQVSVVDVDGTSLTFGSIKEAAAHFGLRAASVSRYLRGVRNDSSGRRWYACL